jgi:hypothetical protein
MATTTSTAVIAIPAAAPVDKPDLDDAVAEVVAPVLPDTAPVAVAVVPGSNPLGAVVPSDPFFKSARTYAGIVRLNLKFAY